MIGTRPAATSMVRRMTSVCSSTSSVADSPVVPTDTIAAEPASITRSTAFARASWSTAPSARIGVTSATMLPVIMMTSTRPPQRTGGGPAARR